MRNPHLQSEFVILQKFLQVNEFLTSCLGPKIFLQLETELFLGRRVFNHFKGIVEDCRPIWHLHELALLKDVHQAGLSHCSVPDDHQLLVLFCHGESAGWIHWDRRSESRAVLSSHVIKGKMICCVIADMKIIILLW